MSVAQDILHSYRSPRATLRRRIGVAAREDRALAVLFGACAVMFVAQWPRLSRDAHLDPSMSIDARLAGALVGWVLIAPLFFYGVAWLSHMALKLAGSHATGFEARMALFWALLAASPLWLLTGLVAGFVGPGASLTITGLAALLAVLVFWITGLAEVATHPKESAV